MKREEYRIAVTTKLSPTQADLLKNTCDFGGIPQSVFIREAIIEKLQSTSIPNTAGSNIIEFNPKTDSFIWKVKLDDGNEKTILEDVSPDFIDDLTAKLKQATEDRNKLLGKNRKRSVAVPRRLVG